MRLSVDSKFRCKVVAIPSDLVNKSRVWLVFVGVLLTMQSPSSAHEKGVVAPVVAPESNEDRAPASEMPRSSNGIHVMLLDSKMHVPELERAGFQIHRPGDRLARTKIPTSRIRNEIFARAGLEAEVSSWDAYDRDRLYMRAASLELSPLAERYPTLPKSKLKTLKKAIQAEVVR